MNTINILPFAPRINFAAALRVLGTRLKRARLCYRGSTVSVCRVLASRPLPEKCSIQSNWFHRKDIVDSGHKQTNAPAAGIAIVYAHCEPGSVVWATAGFCRRLDARFP